MKTCRFILILITSAVVTLTAVVATNTRADTGPKQPSVRVLVNGQAIEADVLELNGKTYLPVDAIARALGIDVTIQTNEVRITRSVPEPVVAAPAPLAAIPTAQIPARVKGFLTYHKNMYESHAPDPAAQVWLLTEEDARALANAAGGTPAEPIPQRQTGWEAKLDAEYKFPKAVADENAYFGFENVSPGSYTLIYLSRRSNGLAARDRNGKMRFKKVEVTPGSPADGSFNFGPTAYKVGE